MLWWQAMPERLGTGQARPLEAHPARALDTDQSRLLGTDQIRPPVQRTPKAVRPGLVGS